MAPVHVTTDEGYSLWTLGSPMIEPLSASRLGLFSKDGPHRVFVGQ